MRKIKILWTDDEIEVLKPHIIFLSEKGYEVDTCSNGLDTLEMVAKNKYDLVFLDEHMPGLSGIDTLKGIKELLPDMPVIMITKSEEENIMEAAIGSKIADYLIKPVKPNQILLSIKKNIDSARLVTEQTTTDYQSEFGKIRTMIDTASGYSDWIDIYRKITHWDIQLDKADDPNLREIYRMQEQEANSAFVKYISRNYPRWFGQDPGDRPLMSHDLLERKVFPLLKQKEKVFLVVIDNLRYDQWKVISKELAGSARISDESLYFSILPTATQYSRNSLFAGMMPLEISRQFSEMWIGDDEEEGKNNFEKQFLAANLERNSLKCNWSYHKINDNNAGRRLNENLSDLLDKDLNVLVYNSVDLLSHARTDHTVLRDIVSDEPAFRSLTRSWFIHSPLHELAKALEGKNVKMVITTDHGTIRVINPVKVIGDKKTSPNLRYKTGKNLDYDPSEVFGVQNPRDVMLPLSNVSSKYIFAGNYDFLVYPNNYNHFVNYYRNTFQHGGISMQEIMIPVVTIEPV